MIVKTRMFFIVTFIFFYSQSHSRIHIFGDSHASFCFSNERTAIPRNEKSVFNYAYKKKIVPIQFEIHWFESKTMFGIGRDGFNILNLKKFGVKENDIVVFVFGEIDARCHIGKQRDLKNRDLTEIIHSLAKSYVRTIRKNRIMFKNLDCVIVSITPPTNNAYNWVYPYHGSLEDRVFITRQLNAKLKALCDQYGFFFLDIYSLYSNSEGFLDDSVSDGVVHVNPFNNDQIKAKLLNLLSVERVLL